MLDRDPVNAATLLQKLMVERPADMAMRGLAERHDLPANVFTGVADGNAAHKRWTERKLVELLGRPGAADDARPLAGRVVAIWGLTYKPSTDTLRRSGAVELRAMFRVVVNPLFSKADGCIVTNIPVLSSSSQFPTDRQETQQGKRRC